MVVVAPRALSGGQPLKFGLGLTGMLQQPRGEDMGRRFAEVVDLVHLARDLGFDYLYAGQHYLSTPYQMLQPLPVMARLSAEAEGMMLVATALLPLHNPVDLAERVATLDVVSGGRAILAVAMGYRPEEYAAFGVEVGDRVSRTSEALHLMTRLWTEGSVTHAGRHFELDGASLGVRPVQRPHPPVWVAANSDAAVRRVARLGFPWYANPHSAHATIRRQVGIYLEAQAAAGHPPPAQFPMYREFFVAPTREEALRMASPFLAGKYDTYAAWGQDRALPGGESFRVPFEDLARDRFIVGDVDDVAEAVEGYRALGATHLTLRMRWPGMDAATAARSMGLAAERVLPAFRG